jgi:hypothetical protein
MEREKRKGGRGKERKEQSVSLVDTQKEAMQGENAKIGVFHREMRYFQNFRDENSLAAHIVNALRQHHLNYLLDLWSDILKSHILAALIWLEEREEHTPQYLVGKSQASVQQKRCSEHTQSLMLIFLTPSSSSASSAISIAGRLTNADSASADFPALIAYAKQIQDG